MSQPARQGIADLFDQHFDAVYSYVAYRLAPDREAARDVTQEVFLAAAVGLAGLQTRSSAATWLRAVARRKVADHFRRAAARARAQQAYTDVLTAHAVSHVGNGEAQELSIRVARVMRELGHERAELLELKYLDGLSVKEIAAMQGETEKAVESALSRARATFREFWALADQHKE